MHVCRTSTRQKSSRWPWLSELLTPRCCSEVFQTQTWIWKPFPFCPRTEKSTLWTDAGVDQIFQRDWEPLVHMNFRGNPYGPIPWCLAFRGTSVWTSGAESPSKVSPQTGIDPWMALPAWRRSQPTLSWSDVLRSGEKIYTHTPLPEVIFKGEGGCVYFEATAAGFLYAPPLFYVRPPPLEGCFQGWGSGGGVYKLAPHESLRINS